jgi:uncharacterized protein
VRVLEPKDHRIVPWKNGGGSTREIFTAPVNATIDLFDVRVSAATVEKDGPFSLFNDVERTLVVTSGRGITLTREGRDPVVLDQTSPPFAFPGDVLWNAALTSGPIEDFNVMTRRGRAFHSVFRLDFDGTAIVAPARDLTFVALLSGVVRIEAAPSPLARGSVIVIEKDESAVTLRARGTACVLRVEIEFA